MSRPAAIASARTMPNCSSQNARGRSNGCGCAGGATAGWPAPCTTPRRTRPASRRRRSGAELDRGRRCRARAACARSRSSSGPRADDPQPRRAGAVACQQRDGAQHVLVALLPDQPPGREDHVLGRRRRRPRAPKRSTSIPGGQTSMRSSGDALEQQRLARALGRGQEQVGRREHLVAVAARVPVAVGAQERQRLPDRLHELSRAAALRRAASAANQNASSSACTMSAAA